MENLIEKYSVSRETLSKLKTYETLLNEWQNKFNLVSNASLPDAWKRHFLDSLQLLKFIPDTAKLMYDFGSGAGFPGLVLAVVLQTRTPYLKIKLVESIKKKTLYLNAVASELELNNVEVLNDRIENLPAQKADVITSRAMSSLDDLLKYAFKFCHKGTKCIFPKGKKYQEELSAAQQHWNFSYDVYPSESSAEGVVLVITDLSLKRRN